MLTIFDTSITSRICVLLGCVLLGMVDDSKRTCGNGMEVGLREPATGARGDRRGLLSISTVLYIPLWTLFPRHGAARGN